MKKDNQIALGKKPGALILAEPRFPDTLDAWAEAYFQFEVTTSPASRKVQKRDLRLFLEFMAKEEGALERPRWTPRLSKDFVEFLRSAVKDGGKRRWGDKTINRILAHLKTFAKWIHKLRPFPLGEPTAKLKSLVVGAGLEIERALTPSERRRLLDAADLLPTTGGRSKDRRRYKNGERPLRKGYRPWRNRAIIYTLIETGMRRSEAVNLDLAGVDFKTRTLNVQIKGGYTHPYKISKQGLEAIEAYLKEERERDSTKQPSPALFLPANTVTTAKSRLSSLAVTRIWQEVCSLAGVEGKSPHAARHGMGKHIIDKTGNISAVQRQLGHRNAAYSMQYARISDQELEEVLDER